MKKSGIWLAFTAAILCVFASCKPEVKIVEKEKIVEAETTDDTVAPSSVTNLAATAKDSRILLTWTDAADAIAKTSMLVPQGAGGCYVSGLTNGTEYTFTVKTVDTSENKSEGATVKATPIALSAGETLKINLSADVPHENGQRTVNTVHQAQAAIKG